MTDDGRLSSDEESVDGCCAPSLLFVTLGIKLHFVKSETCSITTVLVLVPARTRTSIEL